MDERDGHAAQPEAGQGAAPVGGHDEQVSPGGRGMPADRVGDRTVQQGRTQGDVRNRRETLGDRIEVRASALLHGAVDNPVVSSILAIHPPHGHVHANDSECRAEPARKTECQRQRVFAEIRAVQRDEE
jgi:hypothetical protein